MPIKVSFEIPDADLEYFREVIRKAQDAARGKNEYEIVTAARHAAFDMRKRKLPEFVEQRITALDLLTRMLEDKDWRLEPPHRTRVLQALTYFSEPSDLIPDQIPVLGFLDDAIMVELVVQELRPEIDAYQDFCRYRDEQEAERGKDPEAARKRLEARRRTIYGRIERRREQRERRGGTFSLFRD
ncbi:MAG: YkvA family protein [Candidatus Limnocylindria bacterium]